ncbi:hypothetical protein H6F67_27170 [Microcoleus sp. FACHB-1515]|uniref:hypothetical protein n=1 Tax=Cyanophyceae TaxID=3028117 RepID=UPI0016838327|nr:hypothetical protein [Microcoleus sp. FACHB-1515]MBD2093520.1 hypothetical protein [Microcoleus sp. FACHB-1515]
MKSCSENLRNQGESYLVRFSSRGIRLNDKSLETAAGAIGATNDCRLQTKSNSEELKMFGAHDPRLVMDVISIIAKDREKTEQAILAIELAKTNQQELYVKFCNLPDAVKPDCLARLKRIAGS